MNDGIINGAECCIKYIETKQDENKKVIPTIIWVQLENEKNGKDHRQKNSYLYQNKQINHKWTPITKIHRSFLVKNIWIHCIQFPINQAAARTIHVSQSSMYNKIYVTKYEGLYIADINKTQICVSKKVSEYLLQAHKNKSLKILINISWQNKINILFNNTRSFKKYYHIIKQNIIIKKQDINIFLESKLWKYDQNKDYIISDYILVRADEKSTTNPYHGIIAYIHKNVQLIRIKNKSKESIDTLLLNIIYNGKNITLISIYKSPKTNYKEFENHIMEVIKEEKKYTQNIVLLGDLNINISSPNYIQLSHKLLINNMKQYILDYPTVYRTTIDYIFSNIKIQNIQNLHSHCLDHNIIHFEIE